MAGIIDFTVGIIDFTAVTMGIGVVITDFAMVIMDFAAVIMGIGVAIMDFTVTATMGPEEEVAIKRSRAFAHYERER